MQTETFDQMKHSAEVVISFHQFLNRLEVMDKYPPTHIINLDETTTLFNQPITKTVAVKGGKAGKDKEATRS